MSVCVCVITEEKEILLCREQKCTCKSVSKIPTVFFLDLLCKKLEIVLTIHLSRMHFHWECRLCTSFNVAYKQYDVKRVLMDLKLIAWICFFLLFLF